MKVYYPACQFSTKKGVDKNFNRKRDWTRMDKREDESGDEQVYKATWEENEGRQVWGWTSVHLGDVPSSKPHSTWVHTFNLEYFCFQGIQKFPKIHTIVEYNVKFSL